MLPGEGISTTSSSLTDRLAVPKGLQSAKLYRYIKLKLSRKTFKRRTVRVGLLVSNLIILVAIAFFVINDPHTNGLSAPVLQNSPVSAASNPLDQASSIDIALTVARMNSMPEATAVTNQAQTQAAEVAIAGTANNVVNEPQVVATALKSKADIQQYTVQSGDSIPSLAAKFGITSDSIRWSNGLSGDSVNTGTKLTIPPVNGVIYTVKPGDTADSLAVKFKANRDQIVAYNDAEITGLKAGEQIIIPGATQPVVAVAAVAATTTSFPWGTGPIYGSNGYDYGYCTWYVATQVAVPSNWGNASSWAYYARLSGWNVSKAPTVGAIAQTGNAAGGLGHVAIVTGVNADGSVTVRDMNGFAGWGRVGTGTVGAGVFQNFITP